MKKQSQQTQVNPSISVEDLISKYLNEHPEIDGMAKTAVAEDLKKLTKKSSN